MQHNQSPWLHQLNRQRPLQKLTGQLDTKIAIIGGGIAGIATAYYLLKNTDQEVTLIEAGQVAHGASGHNGGFLATYFERTFSSLVQEYGLKKSAEAQLEMEYSWYLLEQLIHDIKLQTQVLLFTGLAGCVDLQEVLVHLRNNELRHKAGISVPQILVSHEAEGVHDIPDIYAHLYTLVEKQKILDLLETEDESYIAILQARKGCSNSALLCEEIAGYLLATYPERFKLLEHTPVRRLVLKKQHAVLDISKNLLISAEKVVLCTNGFEKIDIVNLAGPGINKKFHAMVRGIVGYMAGYTEERNKPPIEISYLPKRKDHTTVDIFTETPYFYLTRRPYDAKGEENKSLICIGGPEALMDDTNDYTLEHPFPDEAKRQIDNFLKYTYKPGPNEAPEYKFMWHGLMGFTPNGLRLIGPEPANPLLYYNLGCNGVGLMPSIYGGYKISQFIAGIPMKPSLFDPQDARVKRKYKAKAPRDYPKYQN